MSVRTTKHPSSVLRQMSADSPIPGQSPFIKQLAANDRPTRDAAVDALRAYIGGRRHFTKMDFLKLWKALFYCMWMSDRPRTQQRLANDLASLVDNLQEEHAFLFLECFWETMAREWDGIDALRMDKFLLLVRRYLASSLRYLMARDWVEEEVKSYMGILKETPLHPTSVKIPNGLRYHLIDIYLDELEKIFPLAPEASHKLPIDLLLDPFEQLLEKSPTKVMRVKAKEMLLDHRLEHWGYSNTNSKSDGEADISEDDDEEWGGFD